MRPRQGEWGFVLALAITFAAAPAAATTWIVPEQDEMVESADAVVLATVERIRSVAEFDGSGITTEVTLHVQEGYKGAVAGERIVLHEVGGRVGLAEQWAFGSPEYRVGETVVAYVERAGRGRLRTQHMAIGKLGTQVLEDGRVVLSRVRRGGGHARQLLSSFKRGIAIGSRRPRGAVRLAGRLQPSAPRLEGISAAQAEFRLMQPGSRWFDTPVDVFGDISGVSGLSNSAADRVVQGAAEAWNGHAGSEFEARYAGNKNGPGFQCNPGYITVSFDDPREQVGDPTGCGGGALAVGGFCATGSTKAGTPYREITGGAVVFNDGWDQCWFWNEKNLTEIGVHEIGHAIGFAHSWDSYLGSTNDPFVTDATMFWMAHFDGRGGGIRDYDKGALAYLYDDGGAQPPPPPSPTPNPTPTPAPPEPTPQNDDDDGDGVDNAKDNCPDMANSLQDDADGDGVGDACDACNTSSDPNASCSALDGSARIVVKKKGTNATVRVQFPPWVGNLNQDLDVDLVGANGTVSVSIPGDEIRLNGAGTNGRYRNGQVSLTIRKYGGGMTRVTLRVKSDALGDLAGPDLTVHASLPGHSASGQMTCFTRTPDKRQITSCKVD